MAEPVTREELINALKRLYNEVSDPKNCGTFHFKAAIESTRHILSRLDAELQKKEKNDTYVL